MHEAGDSMQPLLPAGSCPLRSESDLHPALPRNDAMGFRPGRGSSKSGHVRCALKAEVNSEHL